MTARWRTAIRPCAFNRTTNRPFTIVRLALAMKASEKSRQELEKRLKESEKQLEEVKETGRSLPKNSKKFKRKRKYYQQEAEKYKKYFDRARLEVAVLLVIVFALLIYDLVYSKIIVESIKQAGYAVIFPVVVVFISLYATLNRELRVLEARHREANITALDYERKILVEKTIAFYAAGKEELLRPLLQQYTSHLMRQSAAEVAIALRNRDGEAADSTVIQNVAGWVLPKGDS